MDKRKTALISAFAYSLIFGFSFLFTKMTLRHTSGVFHLLSARFIIAFATMTLLILLKVVRIDYRGKNLLMPLLLSVFQPVLYFTFETMGISVLSSAQAGIMIAFIPVATILFASVAIKEKTAAVTKFFILLSVAGAVLLSLNDLGEGNWKGILYLLIAVFSAAIYGVLSRRLSVVFDPVSLTYMMMGTGAGFFTLICFITYHEMDFNAYFKPFLESAPLAGLLYLGLLSSVAAFFMMNYTLSRIKASEASVFANLTTVIAAAAGAYFLKETLYLMDLAGGALIIAGVLGAVKATVRQ